MKKISARDIQLFVGGALALIGFRALIWIPYYIMHAHYVVIVSSLITGLTLPIGLGIFFGKPNAMLWAQIYLWLNIGAAMIMLPFYWFTSTSAVRATLSPENVVPGLLTNLALAALIFWSGSHRIANNSPAPTDAGRLS